MRNIYTHTHFYTYEFFLNCVVCLFGGSRNFTNGSFYALGSIILRNQGLCHLILSVVGGAQVTYSAGRVVIELGGEDSHSEAWMGKEGGKWQSSRQEITRSKGTGELG